MGLHGRCGRRKAGVVMDEAVDCITGSEGTVDRVEGFSNGCGATWGSGSI